MRKKKTLVLRTSHFILIGITIAFFIACVAFFLYIYNNTKIRTLQAELNSQKIRYELQQKEINEWKEQSFELMKIKNEYQHLLREVVDLVYLKRMSIGGFTLTDIEASDEITIKMLRDTIASIQEERQLMSNIKGYLESRRRFINEFPFIYPIGDGSPVRISSDFGFREDVFGRNRGLHFHTGVDFPGNWNDPIIATADGTVILVYLDHEIYGKVVIIEHNFNLFTYYAHLNEIKTTMGRKVRRGETIGLMGMSGPTDGVHLHYEVRLGMEKNSVPLDPKMFFAANY